MKLSTREDIEVPIAYVFDRVSDFSALERRALRQGAQVTRRQNGPYQEGDIWDITFKFRGRDRGVMAELTRFEHPTELEFDSASDGLNALMQVTLVALSPERTRVLVSFELRAKTVTARVLLQSLKLAKASMSKRLAARVQDYAGEIEDRFRRGV